MYTDRQQPIKDIISLVLMFIFMSTIISSCAKYLQKQNKKEIDKIQSKVNNFERAGYGKVIQIYSYRTGIKNANYCYHNEVTLENKFGERVVAKSLGKPVVMGDIWSLTVSEWNEHPIILKDIK